MARACEQLNALIVEAGLPRVTACLLNHYPQDEGKNVWHRDEIRVHGPDPVVVSISQSPTGTRSFMIHSNAKQNVVQTRLAHGSAIIMAGRAAQEAWMHRLPLEDPAPQRISLTFRSIVPGLEDAVAVWRQARRLCVCGVRNSDRSAPRASCEDAFMLKRMLDACVTLRERTHATSATQPASAKQRVLKWLQW